MYNVIYEEKKYYENLGAAGPKPTVCELLLLRPEIFFLSFSDVSHFLYLKYFNFRNLGAVAPNPAVGEVFFPAVTSYYIF